MEREKDGLETAFEHEDVATFADAKDSGLDVERDSEPAL